MADDELAGLPSHLEDHIGPIAEGWSDTRRSHGVQVIRIADRPSAGVNTFATLGFSHHPLVMPSSGVVRQELLLSARLEFNATEMAKLLMHFAEERLRSGRAFLRGEILDLGGPIVQGSLLTYVFVTRATPFEDALAEFAVEPPLLFANLIPVTSIEAMHIQKRGWRWFEEHVAEHDVKVWDLDRSSSV